MAASYSTGVPSVVAPDDTEVVIISAAQRKGERTIFNSSDKKLAIGLGFEPSLPGEDGLGATLVMAAEGYYEVPFWYRGIIYGIWEADAAGDGAFITSVGA